jgi:hypothetical protein
MHPSTPTLIDSNSCFHESSKLSELSLLAPDRVSAYPSTDINTHTTLHSHRFPLPFITTTRTHQPDTSSPHPQPTLRHPFCFPQSTSTTAPTAALPEHPPLRLRSDDLPPQLAHQMRHQLRALLLRLLFVRDSAVLSRDGSGRSVCGFGSRCGSGACGVTVAALAVAGHEVGDEGFLLGGRGGWWLVGWGGSEGVCLGVVVIMVMMVMVVRGGGGAIGMLVAVLMVGQVVVLAWV